MSELNPTRAESAVLREINRLAGEIQHDMIGELKMNKTRASGVLIKSVTYDVKKTADGVSAHIGPTASYAAHIEYGTRPHWPPPDAIRDWVNEKFRGQIFGPSLRSRAFLVSRAISRRGTKAQPFVEPVSKKYLRIIPDRIANTYVKNA